MIVVLKQNSDKGHVEKLMQHFTDMGLRINYSEGADTTILGLMGDTTRLDERDIMAYDVVERVQRVTEPFKAVNRKFHPEDTIIEVAGRKIGTGYFNVMAGPCSVENEAQIVECAERVKAAGASFLRGGAFKPRTSPYSFQGLEAEGLKLLLEAKRQTGLPIVTEIMSEKHLDLFADVDIIQLAPAICRTSCCSRSWAARKADPPQARSVRHHGGVPHGCRVHFCRRQYQCYPV